MSDSDNKEGKHGKQYSYTTHVITFILKAADCPSKFRPFLDILIGIADGRTEFEASDAEVAGRYKGRSQKGATKQWASDKRKELKKWQDENGLLFVEYIHGKQENYTKTSYILHLPKYVEQVEAEARKNELEWTNSRDTAIYKAAIKLIDYLQKQSGVTSNTTESTKGYLPPNRVTQQLKTARTWLEKAEILLKKYDLKPDMVDKEIIEDIEKTIASIKQRGFVDILDAVIFGSLVED